MAAKQKRTKTTPSSVCRVNKNANYTVISNYHLRSMNLSLKAIGLLSKVLSLPEEWDYSISGLTSICKEKETAIKAALDELKYWGYLKVTKLMPNETNSGRIEYVYDFYEYSEKDKPDRDQNDEDTYDGDYKDSVDEIISKITSDEYADLRREIGEHRMGEDCLYFIPSVAKVLRMTEGTLRSRPLDIQLAVCKRYTDTWYCDIFTIQRELNDALMLRTKTE